MSSTITHVMVSYRSSCTIASCVHAERTSVTLRIRDKLFAQSEVDTMHSPNVLHCTSRPPLLMVLLSKLDMNNKFDLPSPNCREQTTLAEIHGVFLVLSYDPYREMMGLLVLTLWLTAPRTAERVNPNPRWRHRDLSASNALLLNSHLVSSFRCSCNSFNLHLNVDMSKVNRSFVISRYLFY